MNSTFIYHVWKHHGNGEYQLLYTTNDSERAKADCQNPSGDYVYSFIQVYYGQNG